MVIYHWSLVGIIIAALTLSACNSQNNSSLSKNRKILNGNVNQLLNAPNTKLYEFEEEVIQDALINADVIGIIGYAFYKQNKKDVRMISIDGISPSSYKNYPFTSPMFIYTDRKLIYKRPEVKGFINFYLKNVDK